MHDSDLSGLVRGSRLVVDALQVCVIRGRVNRKSALLLLTVVRSQFDLRVCGL